jgi:hypothetical protein
LILPETKNCGIPNVITVRANFIYKTTVEAKEMAQKILYENAEGKRALG